MPESNRFVPHSRRAVTVQSRSFWAIEIGRFRLAFTRGRETRGVSPIDRRVGRIRAPRGGRPFAAGAVAGIGAVALIVVGASAAPRTALPDSYIVSVPVPGVSPLRSVRPARRKAALVRAVMRPAAALTASGERFDAADEPYVARAMTTGAFQEWEDGAGQRRFLTAGPVRATGGRWCRDMALLVRLAEGGSRVRSAERCGTTPIGDTAAASPDPAPDTVED